jgi:hypothetical protein
VSGVPENWIFKIQLLQYAKLLKQASVVPKPDGEQCRTNIKLRSMLTLPGLLKPPRLSLKRLRKQQIFQLRRIIEENWTSLTGFVLISGKTVT